MNWSQLWGQEQTIEAFKRGISERNLAHGIFLWGAEGTGKSLAASLLAAHWLCQSPTADGACGHCYGCQLRLHENHPDYTEIDLEEGARTIGIEAARQVGKILSLAPNITERRVIVFPHGGALTVEAANSLLKSIEEPPEGTLFILEARTEEELLPTIRSRCQSWRIQSLSDAQTAQWLNENKNIPENQAELYARLGGGSIGVALKLLENEGVSHRDGVLNWLRDLPRWNGVQLLQAAAMLDKEKKEKELHPIICQIEEGFSIFRDLLIYQETKDSSQLINKDRAQEIINLHLFWQGDVVLEGWNLLERAQFALKRNGNPRLWTEWLWIHFSQKLDKLK